jgi:hypothetical protein
MNDSSIVVGFRETYGTYHSLYKVSMHSTITHIESADGNVDSRLSLNIFKLTLPHRCYA